MEYIGEIMSGTSNTRLKKHIGGLPKLDLVRNGDPGQELEHHSLHSLKR